MPQTNLLKTPDAPPAAGATSDENDADESSEKSGRNSYKIQIQLSPQQRTRLFKLRDVTEVESATQVVRDALKLYDHIVERVVLGDSRLFFEDKNTGRSVEVLI